MAEVAGGADDAAGLRAANTLLRELLTERDAEFAALCGAHLLRELTAVTETGTDLDRTWAQQAIDALLALEEAAGSSRDAGKAAIAPRLLAGHEDWFRKAAAAGIMLNSGRSGNLQQNGTPSQLGCRPARTTTFGSPQPAHPVHQLRS